MIKFMQVCGTVLMGTVFTAALVYVAVDMFFILSALVWVHQ